MSDPLDAWNLAADLGLDVRERRGTHRSGYAPGVNYIDITPGMRGRVLRGVMYHEIGHHVLGHRPTEFGLMRKRQETATNCWAVQQLITPDAYAEAERRHDGHLKSMAVELYVPDEFVMIYRNILLRTDTSVYVAPRLGSGQWGHRAAI